MPTLTPPFFTIERLIADYGYQISARLTTLAILILLAVDERDRSQLSNGL